MTTDRIRLLNQADSVLDDLIERAADIAVTLRGHTMTGSVNEFGFQLEAFQSVRKAVDNALTDVCKHDLDPRTCSTCLHGPEIREPLTAKGRPFASRYDGDCRGCGFPIAKGQSIVRMSDETYQHEACQ